jgi:hypothetical protein
MATMPWWGMKKGDAAAERTVKINASAYCEPVLMSKAPQLVRVSITPQPYGGRMSFQAVSEWFWAEEEGEPPKFYEYEIRGKEEIIIPGAQVRFVRGCSETKSKGGEIELEMINPGGQEIFYLDSIGKTKLGKGKFKGKASPSWQKNKLSIGYGSAMKYNLGIILKADTPQRNTATLHFRLNQ